tara:strand:+ start:20 stop:547 length:528 start_codon:yes stop_codon:yes gene_type:complete
MSLSHHFENMQEYFLEIAGCYLTRPEMVIKHEEIMGGGGGGVEDSDGTVLDKYGNEVKLGNYYTHTREQTALKGFGNNPHHEAYTVCIDKLGNLYVCDFNSWSVYDYYTFCGYEEQRYIDANRWERDDVNCLWSDGKGFVSANYESQTEEEGAELEYEESKQYYIESSSCEMDCE